MNHVQEILIGWREPCRIKLEYPVNLIRPAQFAAQQIQFPTAQTPHSLRFIEQILIVLQLQLSQLARFKQGVESIGHFVEAVAYLAEFIACTELDPLAQVAAGKGVCGMNQRFNAADNGVVDADRDIDHQQKQQQGGADSYEQRLFRLGNTRLDEHFGRRQQYLVHLRVAVVDLRSGHIHKAIRGRSKMTGEDI